MLITGLKMAGSDIFEIVHDSDTVSKILYARRFESFDLADEEKRRVLSSRLCSYAKLELDMDANTLPGEYYVTWGLESGHCVPGAFGDKPRAYDLVLQKVRSHNQVVLSMLEEVGSIPRWTLMKRFESFDEASSFYRSFSENGGFCRDTLAMRKVRGEASKRPLVGC